MHGPWGKKVTFVSKSFKVPAGLEQSKCTLTWRSWAARDDTLAKKGGSKKTGKEAFYGKLSGPSSPRPRIEVYPVPWYLLVLALGVLRDRIWVLNLSGCMERAQICV